MLKGGKFLALLLGVLFCFPLSINGVEEETYPASPSNATGPYITAKINGADIFNNDMITSRPKITFSVTGTVSIESSAVRLFIDEKEVLPPSLKMGKPTISRVQGSFEAADREKLAVGDHKIQIYAADSTGQMRYWERKGLHVYNGEIKIVDEIDIAPTPLNDGVNINYKLTRDAPISIYLYDMMGRLIWRSNYDEGQSGGRAGINQITWKGSDADGHPVAVGKYPFRLLADMSGAKKAIGKGTVNLSASHLQN